MGNGVWRLDPEVDPGSVGVDSSVLDKMQSLFAQGIERGELCHGAQLAMHRGGKRVLDVGGGMARVRLGAPVRPDTMFVVFSATKGLAALAMWRLYERRAFHFDEPLKRYWPEFDRVIAEKAQVTIRHVMSHRGGFPQPPEWLTARYWSDRAALVKGIEEAPLVWSPGAKNGYHPMNFGHVLNELIQRIDGRDCGQMLREEVFAPLGLRDIYVGLGDDPRLEERVAWVSAREVGQSAAEAAGVAAQTGAAHEAARPGAAAAPAHVPERYRDTPELAHPMNRPEVHRAVLPAGGGIATARDLSAAYAPLALGGKLGDVQLLRADSLEHAATPTNRSGDIDRTLRMPIRWGTGWHLGNYGKGSSLRSFGHGGAGGQVAFADRERGLSFAFTTTGQLAAAYLAWRTELQDLAFAACRD
jgi:CubicO group peptidase (beta-lactamase class C family)